MRSMATSSSSATICRIAARPPVPRSTFPVKTVTVLSAWIARKASTWSGATVLPRYRSVVQAVGGRMLRGLRGRAPGRPAAETEPDDEGAARAEERAAA